MNRILMLIILAVGLSVALCTESKKSGMPQAKEICWDLVISEPIADGSEVWRMVIKGEAGGVPVEFAIRLPEGKTEQISQEKPPLILHRFIAVIEPTASGPQALDEALGRIYGVKASLFKSRGYIAMSPKDPKSLVRDGGRLLLSDPAIEGELFWALSIDLDLKRHAIQLRIREANYR